MDVELGGDPGRVALMREPRLERLQQSLALGVGQRRRGGRGGPGRARWRCRTAGAGSRSRGDRRPGSGPRTGSAPLCTSSSASLAQCSERGACAVVTVGPRAAAIPSTARSTASWRPGPSGSGSTRYAPPGSATTSASRSSCRATSSGLSRSRASTASLRGTVQRASSAAWAIASGSWASASSSSVASRRRRRSRSPAWSDWIRT